MVGTFTGIRVLNSADVATYATRKATIFFRKVALSANSGYKGQMRNENSDFVRLDMGAAIRRIREAKGRTLQEVASAIGLHKATLSKIENNKQGYSGETIAKLAVALGVRELDFFKEADPDEPGIQGAPTMPREDIELLDALRKLRPTQQLLFRAQILDEAAKITDPPSFNGLTGQKKSA